MFAASKTGRAAPSYTSDPYFPYVPLLLETSASSTRSTTVTDGAATPNTVTRNGTPSTGWTSPYQTTGYWSGVFNGSSDYLTLPSGAAISGTGAFTTEFWVNMTATQTYSRIISGAANVFSAGYSSNGDFFYGKNGVNNIFAGTITSPLNTWVHVVIARNASSTYRIWVNGTSVSTGTDSNSYSAATVYVGATSVPSAYLAGYLSNLRITNTDVYGVSNTSITVPTTPLTAVSGTSLLTLQDNRFKDNSTNAFAITTAGSPQTTPYYYPSGFSSPTASPGAGLFNGTTDYLTAPSNAAFGFGTGDFTVEGWFYPTSATSFKYLLSIGSDANFSIALNSGSYQPYFYAGSTIILSSVSLVGNQWNHVALVRSGTTATMYINGVSGGSATFSASVAAGILYVGIQSAVAYYFPGYVSNLRLVKGTAVYSGNFTPPSNFVTQTGGTYPSTTNVNTSIPSANTSLLLNLADSNYTSATSGVQNNTFIDSSNYAFPITRNGTPTQGSFTPYQPSGYWSGYFGGSSDYLSVPANTAFDFSTGDCTIEAWIFTNSLSATQTIFGTFPASGTVTGYSFNVLTSGYLNIDSWISGTEQSVISSSNAITANSWFHVAFTRSGGTNRLFVNGNLCTLSTNNLVQALNSGANPAKVGYQGYTGFLYPFNGYISNIRVVKGTAVYTSAFTPSTTPLTAITNTSLLTLQNNRFIDNSTNAFAVTTGGVPKVQAFQPFSPAASYAAATYGGSGYFNGTSDYLSTASNAALGVSSSDFTIETWVYFTDVTGYQIVFDARTAQPSQSPLVTLQNTSRFQYLWNGVSFVNFGPTTLSPYVWYHVAVVRASGVHTGYVNGVSYSLSTTDAAGVSSAPVILGARTVGGANDYLKGYLSNFRFVKGTAIYTAAFTPPTLPVTAVSGTSLLTNFGNAGIYDAAWQNDETTVGDAKAKTVTPVAPFGTTAMVFDGTGDALSIPSSAAFGLGTGDWTIEFWLYLNSTALQNVVSMSSTNAVGSQPHIYYANASGIRYYVNGADRITGGALSTGVWYFISVSRASGSTKMYINGVQTGSTYVDSTNYGTTNPLFVADYSIPLTGVSTLNGYMQDLRVSKGVARSATTPSAALTSDSYTSILLNTASNNYLGNNQNNKFLDSSTNNFTITRNGTPTQGSFTPYQPSGYWSGYFSGSATTRVSVNPTISAIGTGNFTVEFLYFWTGDSGIDQQIIDLGATGFSIYSLTSTANIAVYDRVANVDIYSTSGYAITKNSWVYVALVRSGTGAGQTALYINGTSVATAAVASNFSSTSANIGCRYAAVGSNWYPVNGYISNLRISNNARTITVPTAPYSSDANTLFLGLQSNRFINSSGTALTTNGTPQVQAFQPFSPAASYSAATYGGSGYLNDANNSGTENISVTTTGIGSNFQYTGNFTIEGWIYSGSLAAETSIWVQYNGSTYFAINVSSANYVLYLNSVSTSSIAHGMTANQWYHIAMVRNSGVITMYTNGISVGTISNSSTLGYTTNNYLRLGGGGGTGGVIPRYNSNFRIVNGTAVYTANFTPPTAPVTAITNTSLLLNFTNAGIYDAAWQNNALTVADAGVATLTSLFNLTPMYFDGTGDYLTSPLNPGTTITSGDFTVEFWLYPSTVATAYQAIVGTREGDTASNSNWIVFLASNQISFQAYSSANANMGSIAHQTNLSANTWYYCAITRSGSTFTIYLNSVAGTSTITSSATIQQSGTTFYLGKVGSGSTISALNGYLQDLRITKGVARTIAIPTTSFPTR